LRKEKIVGGCITQVFSPDWNGPDLKYIPFYDDHKTDLKQSKIYNEYKDADVDLYVVHAGPNGPSREKIEYEEGLGLTELAKKKCVIYSGHDHRGIIYREKSGTLIIRPGMNHIAKVYRDGKDVSKVILYKVA